MDSVIFFDSIVVPVPRDPILHRLRYKKGKTQISAAQLHEMNRFIDDALFDIQLRGAGIRIPIVQKLETETVLSTGRTITSTQIASLLLHSDEIMLIGATAGEKIMEMIQLDSARNQLTRAVVLDAVASVMTDTALDWIIRYFNHSFSRENRRLTKKRFSAGYGDFPLENQDWIYQALKLNRLGVQLTETCMLVPEKSVTAVLGVEKIKGLENG